MATEHQLPTASVSVQHVAADLQHVVQRKLGRCLIRLQQYENQLKAILVHQEVAGATREQVEAHHRERMQGVASQTLGHLIAQLTSSYLTAEGTPTALDEQSGNASSDSIFFRANLRMEMSSADYMTTTRKLKELVGLRNRLVHHFLDGFDIWSEEGCHAATTFLDDSYQCINAEFERLQAWARTADQARAHAAEYFSIAQRVGQPWGICRVPRKARPGRNTYQVRLPQLAPFPPSVRAIRNSAIVGD
jgi:hypothetical protein